MKMLAVIVLFLHIESTVYSQCEGTSIVKSGDRGFAENCSLRCLDWDKLMLEGIRQLSLENCTISRIVNISHNSHLEQLNFVNNELEDLPQDLLQHFTNLNTLYVNGNPLKAIPLSIIVAIHVSFDCSCDVWGNVINSCRETVNCSQSLLKNRNCSFANAGNVLNVNSFYRAECEGLNLIALYVLVPLFILLIAGISVFVLIKYRFKLRDTNSLSPNKRHSLSSSDPGQQRYVSATKWKDTAANSANAECSREASQQQLHKDYENMLMDESSGALGRCDRNPQISDPHYLESDAACGIYLNEQPIYCNYTGSVTQSEDDVYIVPDK